MKPWESFPRIIPLTFAFLCPAYHGSDFPVNWLLPPLADARLFHEDSVHYALDTPTGKAAWKATLPRGGAVVHLGPDARPFTVSMFHQLHCLDKCMPPVAIPEPMTARLLERSVVCAALCAHSASADTTPSAPPSPRCRA